MLRFVIVCVICLQAVAVQAQTIAQVSATAQRQQRYGQRLAQSISSAVTSANGMWGAVNDVNKSKPDYIIGHAQITAGKANILQVCQSIQSRDLRYLNHVQNLLKDQIDNTVMAAEPKAKAKLNVWIVDALLGTLDEILNDARTSVSRIQAPTSRAQSVTFVSENKSQLAVAERQVEEIGRRLEMLVQALNEARMTPVEVNLSRGKSSNTNIAMRKTNPNANVTMGKTGRAIQPRRTQSPQELIDELEHVISQQQQYLSRIEKQMSKKAVSDFEKTLVGQQKMLNRLREQL